MFLGCISNISPSGLTISLPNSLVGYIFFLYIFCRYVKLEELGDTKLDDDKKSKIDFYSEGDYVIVLVMEIITVWIIIYKEIIGWTK